MCIVGAAQLYRPNLLSQLLGVMFPFSSGIRDEREANFSLPYLLRYRNLLTVTILLVNLKNVI